MKNGEKEKLTIFVCVFVLVMISLLAFFIARYPVLSVTPEIARLRYYACQNGIGGGPLSSAIGEYDWRKAFAWRASDTEYRQRQFSQFFETLTPRLYAHLYHRFGPFMWLPFSLGCTLLIGLLIALQVRQWSGDWSAGAVAGSFWLITYEVLIGHHAPVRYAKDLVTLEIMGMVSLLLAFRNRGRPGRWFAAAFFILFWWLGMFTDEYMPFFLPAFALAFFTWPWLKRVRWPLLAAMIVLLALSTWLFLTVLPGLGISETKTAFAVMKTRSLPDFPDLVVRNLTYLAENTCDFLAYTFGLAPPRLSLQTILALAAIVVMVCLVLRYRAGKGSGRAGLFWLAGVVVIGGVLLPEGNGILHQETYYNRPLIALSMVLLGMFTASLFRSGGWRPGGIWLICLTVIASLNLFAGIWGPTQDPEARLTRQGIDTILRLHQRLRDRELKPPVFVSYPRFRDVVNGVYNELDFAPPYTMENGFPWSLYRSIMPRLYLIHFEKGELRANPKQFARWENADEHRYRAAARTYYDMPAGVAWDLRDIWAAVVAEKEITWSAKDGRIVLAGAAVDLLGPAPFTRLNGGDWQVSIPVPPAADRPCLVFAVRQDGATSFFVPEAARPGKRDCVYGWSWRLFSVELMPGAAAAELWIMTEGEAEVIGPVVVPAQVMEQASLARDEESPRPGSR